MNYVIQGLIYAKVTLASGLSSAELARAWAGHVEGMCRVAGLQLDKGEAAKLRAWTGGGLAGQPGKA